MFPCWVEGGERRGGGGKGGIGERGKEPEGDGGDSGNKPERLGCRGAFGGWYVNVGWFFRRFFARFKCYI